MKKINVIIVMAGFGARLELDYNKALYEINQIPLFMYSVNKFSQLTNLNELYLVVNENDFDIVKNIIEQNNINATLVVGGRTRSESVKNGIRATDLDHDVVIHDAARPLTSIDDIYTLIEKTDVVGTLYHDVTDTIKEVKDTTRTIDRSNLKAVTTPQYFSKSVLDKILSNEQNYTDEMQILEDYYGSTYIKETSDNIKVTTKKDLNYVEYLLSNKHFKIGHSYDFHPFESGRPFILGGINVPYEFGLKGHSDADALYHAVAEALIGALGLGDIGTLFPDTDMKYKDMDSSYFVIKVMELMKQHHYVVNNIDAIIYIEKPNLKNYKQLMANNIKTLTNCEYVNVKATTMEKRGIVGNGEGIGCEVVCLIKKQD